MGKKKKKGKYLSREEWLKKRYPEKPKRYLRISDLKEYMPKSIQYVDDLKKLLRLVKLIVTRKDNPLKLGEIVFDGRDKEFGVVICEKPDGNMLYASGLKDHKKILYRNYLVLTLTESEDGDLNFRVRYLNSGMITRLDAGMGIGEQVVGNTLQSMTDLEEFCTTQCLLDCSEECSLWKYTRKTLANLGNGLNTRPVPPNTQLSTPFDET